MTMAVWVGVVLWLGLAGVSEAMRGRPVAWRRLLVLSGGGALVLGLLAWLR
jgi:hypothetical protein